MPQPVILSSWENQTEHHLVPIFPPGFHKLALTDIYQHAVASFPSSKRRRLIWSGLLGFLDELSQWQITGEIWLDGSFFTHKIEPNDIDIIILLDRPPLLAMDAETRGKFGIWLNGRKFLKDQFFCDVYYIDSSNQNRRLYWENWYGMCKDRITQKGIPSIGINHD